MSQLIDMYYNERGNFDNNNYYVASNRSAAFNKSLDKVNLKEQVNIYLFYYKYLCTL